MTTLEITTYRIKLVLEKTGLKQAELARRIGVAQQSVQKWVHGITSPSTANLDKLSEVTGFPPYWFMLPPSEEEQVVVPDTMKIGPRQRELLQTFGAFPEEDQEQMLKDMKDKKSQWIALSHDGSQPRKGIEHNLYHP